MEYSICIPNYNYGSYIGETLRSVLTQEGSYEVLVSDNASTDSSVSVVKAIDDPRVHLSENRRNVGFAGNLDRACASAIGERMVLLSSDDLIGDGGLAAYSRLTAALGGRAGRSIYCSAQKIVDGSGRETGRSELEAHLWQGAVIDPDLTEQVGAKVLRIDAGALLHQSLRHLRSPLPFATTCYPRELYDEVEGYGAAQLINPDKAFAWKLLAVADEVYYVDSPLFCYRVHDRNQNAQQQTTGALKHLVDQYRASFDTPDFVLAGGAVGTEDLAQAFVLHDIAQRGLVAVANGNRRMARRHVRFGLGAYPQYMRRSRWAWALRAALAIGPVGTLLCARLLEGSVENFRNPAPTSSAALVDHG